MSRSMWFTRGWTLQEMIAPTRVYIFDSMWKFIGEKKDIIKELSLIRGVEEGVLGSNRNHVESAIEEVPVARKMSWASERETTRVEDMAYSLLGVFGIKLPLLYGEGERAFIRLQEEIMKHSNDLSLLAWTEPDLEGKNYSHFGYFSVLAPHARYFRKSRTLALIKDSDQMPHFSSTNKGLRLEAGLIWPDILDDIILDINCVDLVGSGQPLGIYLKLKHQGEKIYARTMTHELARADASYDRQTDIIFLSVGNDFDYSNSYPSSQDVKRFFVPKFKDHLMLWYLSEVYPQESWENANESFNVEGLRDFVGCHIYKPAAHHSYKHEQPFHVFFWL